MARLLSVNVGLPKDVEWQGRIVHTGIWKDPVDGSRMVRRLNIDGDGQGTRSRPSAPEPATALPQALAWVGRGPESGPGATTIPREEGRRESWRPAADELARAGTQMGQGV